MKINFPELFILLLLMIHPNPDYRPNVVEMNKNIQILIKNYTVYPKKYTGIFDENLSKELSTSISF
jgi:hypothetical protein